MHPYPRPNSLEMLADKLALCKTYLRRLCEYGLISYPSIDVAFATRFVSSSWGFCHFYSHESHSYLIGVGADWDAKSAGLVVCTVYPARNASYQDTPLPRKCDGYCTPCLDIKLSFIHSVSKHMTHNLFFPRRGQRKAHVIVINE
jgi:hypothetical protein